MTIKNPETDHSPFPKDLQAPRTLITPLFSLTPTHALALNNIYKSRYADERTLFIPKTPHCTTSKHPRSHCKKLKKRHCPQIPKLCAWNERRIDMGAKIYTTDPLLGLLPGRKLEAHALVPRHIQEEDAFPKTMIRRREYEEGKLYPAFGSIDYEQYLHYIKRRGRCIDGAGGEMVQDTKVCVEAGLFHSDTVTKEDFPAPFRELGNQRFEMWFMRNITNLGVKEDEARMRLGQVFERTRVEQNEREEGEGEEKKESLVTKLLGKIGIGKGVEKYKEKRRGLEARRREKKHKHWVQMEDENRKRETLKQVADKIKNERQQQTQQGLLQRLIWWR